jgi:hypothetical protein
LTREFHFPACSALDVSHVFDGLLLQLASGPFQTGAAPGVHPSELCSSSDSRTPFGAVTLMLFVVTAVFHSEVVWKVTVLRSFKVLLRPLSPYPVEPSLHRRPLLSWVFSSSRSSPHCHGRHFYPPPSSHFCLPGLRRGQADLCLEVSLRDAVRPTVARGPTLMRFFT